MRPHTECLVDALATARTVLCGELWRDGDDRNVMQFPIIVDPDQEPSPRGIADGLREFVVLDQIGDLQVFIGNQIARCDKRACRLPGKVFTLPLYFQIRFGKPLPSLPSILALLLFLGDSAVQAFQFLFGEPQKARDAVWGTVCETAFPSESV